MTQEFDGIESEVFKVEDRDDNTIPVYKLEFWKLCLLIVFYLTFAFMTNTGQVMIIWYIRWYAPKQRAINRMILVDQVCRLQSTLFQFICSCYDVCYKICLLLACFIT